MYFRRLNVLKWGRSLATAQGVFLFCNILFFFQDIFPRAVIKLKRSFKPGTPQRQTLGPSASVSRSDAIDSAPAGATGEIIENRLWHLFKREELCGTVGTNVPLKGLTEVLVVKKVFKSRPYFLFQLMCCLISWFSIAFFSHKFKTKVLEFQLGTVQLGYAAVF